MFYCFDCDVAKEYGIAEAVIIWHFQFWLIKNRANGEHFYDGHYWTYNSIKAFQELFPFWTVQNIRTALNHLKQRGVIILGNYNKSSYDRTCWYAFADEEKWLGTSQQLDLLELTNGFAKTNKPIPDNIPDNNIIKEKKINKRKETAPEKDFNADVLAEMLEIHLSDVYNRKFTTNDWYKQMELLTKKDGIEFERARDVMNWHFEHLDRPYCHVILSAKAFREKFTALETQMQKNGGTL